MEKTKKGEYTKQIDATTGSSWDYVKAAQTKYHEPLEEELAETEIFIDTDDDEIAKEPMNGFITEKGRLIITSGSEKHDRARYKREDWVLVKSYTMHFDEISAIEHKRMNSTEKDLLCFIIRYNIKGLNCYESNESLAKKLGKNVSTIKRTIRSLEKKKYIIRNKVIIPGGEVRLLSLYRTIDLISKSTWDALYRT